MSIPELVFFFCQQILLISRGKINNQFFPWFITNYIQTQKHSFPWNFLRIFQVGWVKSDNSVSLTVLLDIIFHLFINFSHRSFRSFDLRKTFNWLVPFCLKFQYPCAFCTSMLLDISEIDLLVCFRTINPWYVKKSTFRGLISIKGVDSV